MEEALSWRDLSAFLEEISCPRSREEFLARLLPAVKMLIPYGVAASLIDNHGKCLKCVGFGESTVNAYNTHYVYTLDVLRQSWEEIGINGSCVDVLNWRKMKMSEFAADFARPNGIWSTLSHFLPGYRWSLSVHRGAGEPPFSDSERFIIVAANRHVNQLFTLYNRLEHLPIESPAAEQIRKYLPRLTPREALVCSLYCMGISAPAVASKLCVSTRTVEAQIGSVYLKLGTSTKAELIQMVVTLCDTSDPDERVVNSDWVHERAILAAVE